MESSDISLSSDWDIVNTNSSTSLEDDENIEELPKEPMPNEGPTKTEDEERKGSCVDDMLHPDNGCDSNSSSDVDIIDEVVNGSKEFLESPKIHPMEFSISSSLEDSTTSVQASPEVVHPAPKTENKYVFLNLQLDLFDMNNIVSKLKEHYLLLILSFVITTVLMYKGGSTEDEVKKMIAQVNALKAENTNLKNKVLSKIEDDTLFLALEGQISTLKDENFKLSSSLQSLIHQLEQHTTAFQKENQMRKKDPYKKEIEKLKEQVNMLKIDNDDLQKQLVRMRYGMHLPHPSEADSRKENLEVKEDKNDHASVFLTEEIKDLKKKLYMEVEKLKDWKESINHIVKKLGKHPFNENPESFLDDGDRFEHKKPDEDKPKKEKGRKFYDWSWKDFQKNFKGTLDSLPNINMTDVFSKYMTVDKKKVEGVFESVGHYFKKAQEKTKKMLNSDENVKNDFWNFLGDLRKKWDSAKAEFFENTYRKASFYETGNKQSNDDATKSNRYEGEKMKKTFSHGKADETLYPQGDQSTESSDDFQENERYKGNPEEQVTNSWMLKRAAHRSEIREDTDDNDETNWFLRRKHLEGDEEPAHQERRDDAL